MFSVAFLLVSVAAYLVFARGHAAVTRSRLDDKEKSGQRAIETPHIPVANGDPSSG